MHDHVFAFETVSHYAAASYIVTVMASGKANLSPRRPNNLSLRSPIRGFAIVLTVVFAASRLIGLYAFCVWLERFSLSLSESFQNGKLRHWPTIDRTPVQLVSSVTQVSFD